jgi:ubiquinone/menaquinone biosynthesis C-methylase UbiE
MSWPVLIGVVAGLVALGALLHWQLNLAEGVYLGRRVVVWLYDRFAPRYDNIKQFDRRDEDWFLGGPVSQALRNVSSALVLDVATGTGRLPVTLFRQPAFAGRVVGLDLSREMLRRAATNTREHKDRMTLLWQDATCLPFNDDSFDAVTCLEALEFLPDMQTTLGEMVRVLRPGGILLVTNRIGPGVRWMPGRTMRSEHLAGFLESTALADVRTAVWQIDYDLVWARKRATLPNTGRAQHASETSATLPSVLRCPNCANTPLNRHESAYHCQACDSQFPVAEDGVIEMGF